MNDKLKNSIKTKIAISNFKKENVAMKQHKKYIINIVAGVCVCLILTSGIVFAKDIETIIKNLFSNTTPAIEKAVQNGYVQNIYGDFVYDQGIGVKTDNIVLDELNLNISFLYENKNENIKSMRLNKFIIRTDTGEKIFDSDQQYTTSLDDVYTASSMNWFNQPEKVEDYIFKDSILFTLSERSKEKQELKFEIQSMNITYQNDTKEEIFGNWNFNIKIKEEMRKSQTIHYKLLEENEYIESCTGILSPTGFNLEIILKEPLDFVKFLKENENNSHGHMLFYYKENNQFIEPVMVDCNEIKYTMPFDNISSLDRIPEKIEIFADPFNISIFLTKEL